MTQGGRVCHSKKCKNNLILPGPKQMDPGSQTQGVDALVSDIFGNDDEPEEEGPGPTEDEHKGIIDDIFGGDSDDEPITASNSKVDGYYDNLMEDSDSDGEVKPSTKRLRLSKGDKRVEKGDSDDDDNNEYVNEERLKRKARIEKKRKLKEKKREIRRKEKSKRSDKKRENVDSGDEYDSGEDVKRTRADDDFIAAEDDGLLRGVVNEYDDDNQDFDDERPDHKKGKGKNSVSRSSSGISKTASDPLSMALSANRAPKKTELNEQDKSKLAQSILEKMDLASRKDDECYAQHKPAIHKAALLDSVKTLVNMKELQNTLLDYDILSVFKDWIEPKDANNLPSLTVRTAVYEMLWKLPCATDHLKRAAPGKTPIGTTILALRKHKNETVENKRLLKELMAKWCRPVFSSSIAISNAVARTNMEIQNVSLKRSQNAAATASANTTERSGIDDVLTGKVNANSEQALRTRVPQSKGFLFTVDSNITGNNVVAANNKRGDTRDMLFKKVREGKSDPNSVGKKVNIRAVDMNMNGKLDKNH